MGRRTPLKIMLVDDHAILRHGLRSSFESVGDTVVAEAANGREAIELAARHFPNVILMDINMPELNGVDATRRILENNPRIKIIGLSMYSDPPYVMGMLDAGASGFLLKTCSFNEVETAIKDIMAGKIYLCSEVTSIVVDNALNPSMSRKDSLLAVMTNRDREVLQLISEGRTSGEIARILKISKRTVDNHRANLMDKLDIHSVAGLTRFALREGITSL
ncbi:MAG: response regulator transcription factor [Pseudomonadota bacterium]